MKRATERASLRAHIREIEIMCESVRYSALPAVGGTAHVVEVVYDQTRYKTVGRSRAEAYRKMIDHLTCIGPRADGPEDR